MDDTKQEWRQFRDALEQADFSTASTLLQKNPSLIDTRNGIGETVLHFLAVENNRAAVEWLYNQKADLNVMNKFGTPLLFEVSLLSYRELFLWLVQHGADPNKKTMDGQRLEDYLAEFGKIKMLTFVRAHIKH